MPSSRINFNVLPCEPYEYNINGYIHILEILVARPSVRYKGKFIIYDE